MSDKNVIIPLLDAIDIYISIFADSMGRFATERFLLDYFPVISEKDLNEYITWELIDETYRGDIEDAVSNLRALLIEMNKYATEENTSSLKTML